MKKNWNRLFPNIDLSKGFLDIDDISIIARRYVKDLNFNNPSMIEKMKCLAGDIRPIGLIRSDLMKIVNPSGKAGASKRNTDFWINRGYDINEAESLISEIQATNSPRSTRYWIKRGMSLEDAQSKVSDIQSENAKNMHAVIKLNGGSTSCRTVKYWQDKGYSKEESINLVKAVQKKSSDHHVFKREDNHWCLEYWITRGFTIDDYTRNLDRNTNGKTYSNISKSIFDQLAERYRDNKLYYADTEFGKYIPEVGYRKYDYVDLTYNLVIEFHGTWYHSSEEAKKNDTIKRKFMEDLGFKYYEILEDEYRNNTFKEFNKVLDFYENCSRHQESWKKESC